MSYKYPLSLLRETLLKSEREHRIISEMKRTRPEKIQLLTTEIEEIKAAIEKLEEE